MRITMIAPSPGRCGIADYSQYLLAELRQRVEVPYVVEAARFTPEMNAVDLVHVQHQYFLFGGVAPWKCRFRQFANRLRVPAVMTVHEFVSPAGNALRGYALSLSNRLHFRHRAVRRLLVHTAFDRVRMVTAGFPREQIALVRHGVPPPPPLPSREEARRVLGWEDRFVVTVFGFLSRRKGHRIALEALQRLPEQICLLFAGGRHPDDRTHYIDEIEGTIYQNGLTGRTRITGFLNTEQVARVMSATDLILAPFIESSGSGSLALAFACGKPILASDIPPHLEMIADTPDSLCLFPSENPTALAEAILRLRDDPQALARYSEGAQRYASTHSYARMAEETIAVYRDALMEAA